MNIRTWTIAGYITSLLTLALLLVLATVAFTSDIPMTPRFAVGCIVDLLLGNVSIKLLGGAYTVAAIEERTCSYEQGVSDTVDRLAAALPQAPHMRRVG